MRSVNIYYVREHNGDDTIIYFEDCPGAFVRGRNEDEAMNKAENELISYFSWLGKPILEGGFAFSKSFEHETSLNVRDADSEVILPGETLPLTAAEYEELKATAIKSAECFLALYESVPDKDAETAKRRKTFYGEVPVTANEMYVHTKSVNSYYFGEIGIGATNEPDIVTCRKAGFDTLEATRGFLLNPVIVGSYGEKWSLRKLCRRFVWHDRIHAKAMYRRSGCVINPFMFG